jgi:hypothetical protein
MEHIDAIRKGDPDRNGAVDNPDKMLKVLVAADATDHAVLGEATPADANANQRRGSFQ